MGEGRESSSNITSMSRVWSCVTRAMMVGIREGMIGAVSRAPGLQLRRAVQIYLQGRADQYCSKIALQHALGAWGQYVGVVPPPLVSDYSSDEEAPAGSRSVGSTDSEN